MLALLCSILLPQVAVPDPLLTHGPFPGPIEPTALMVWARARAPGRFELHLQPSIGGDQSAEPLAPITAQARPENDLVLHFTATELEPGAAYDWWITSGANVCVARGRPPLCTAPPNGAGAALVAFGSCAEERRYPEQAIWGQLLARKPQALVLLGDTPYIDDGRVAVRRRRYRAFFDAPAVRAARAAIPVYATWDDHDYATNDRYGDTAVAATARGVFRDYWPQRQYGSGEAGIYQRFRIGPLEVFVLDARSFADREVSPLGDGARSLLGRRQLRWLQQGLRRSTAAFKVLASGMVFNGAVRPGKPDTWATFAAERDGLLRWIGEQHIAGVVLVSGDIHRQRLIMHPVAALAGYDVPELISSPLAQNPLASNDIDIEGLVYDGGAAESVLLLAAERYEDGARLSARFVLGDGSEAFARAFSLRELGGDR